MNRVLSLVCCFIFTTLLLGQSQNWKNHKMTKLDVLGILDQYEPLELDQVLDKLVNDIPYLKALLPMLMRVEQTMPRLNTKDSITISDTTNNNLKVWVKADQYFTSLRDDTVAVKLLYQEQVNSLSSIDSVVVTEGYAGQTIYLDFYLGEDKLVYFPSKSLLDSISTQVYLSITSSIDSLFVANSYVSDSINIELLNDSTIQIVCESSLFPKIFDIKVYNDQGKVINTDSMKVFSPIVDFNFQNSMNLLNSLDSIRSQVVSGDIEFVNKESFRETLLQIFANFELVEVPNFYKCKLFYPSSVNKIGIYSKKEVRKEKLDLTLPLIRYRY